jgi:hypothetical protein
MSTTRSNEVTTPRSIARAGARELAVRREGALAIGATMLGALALGALACGAVAIGTLALGRLAVGKAKLRQGEVDDLLIARLTIRELRVERR